MNDNPYNDSYVVEYQNGEQTLERELFQPTSATSNVMHTVMEGETIQDIAIKYYGDSGSWYKIADYNIIVNPFTEVVADMKLIIPL